MLRVPVALTVAGRTDAGVHATGQVVHLDVSDSVWAVEQDRLVRRLAGVLSADVRVADAIAVPAAFDARFGALWRRYIYRVSDASGGVSPLRRTDTLAWPRPLDLDALRAAAGSLVGMHDFAAFCRPRAGGTTVRELQDLDWVRDDEGVLVATVQADAFCHHMVRGLMGALLAVADGRRPVDWPAELLERTERSGEITVAPAHGLTLVAVGYPDDDQGLRARLAQTRGRREWSGDPRHR